MSLSYKRRKKTLSREQRHKLTTDTIGQTCPHVDNEWFLGPHEESENGTHQAVKITSTRN